MCIRDRSSAAAPLVASSESETVIENDVYRIVFTNRGGRVKSWVLKKQTDDKGGPLELVNTVAAEKYGYPLTLWSYDETLRNKMNSALYVTTSTGSAAPAEIKFAYDDGDISVQKNFTFDRNSYVVGVKTAVYQKSAQVTAFPMWPAGFGSDMTGPQYAAGQVVYQYDDKVERLAIKKISGDGTLPGPLNWAGVSDQYFAAVFLPQDPMNAVVVTLRTVSYTHLGNLALYAYGHRFGNPAGLRQRQLQHHDWRLRKQRQPPWQLRLPGERMERYNGRQQFCGQFCGGWSGEPFQWKPGYVRSE